MGVVTLGSITAGIRTAKAFLDLSKDIADTVEKASGCRHVVSRTVWYLQATQTAVAALGMERQAILTDVRRCDVRERDQVNAAWERLHRYLNEDHVRPSLRNALAGLDVCNQEIVAKADSAWWRRPEKQAAVSEFTHTLGELRQVLNGLSNNFLFLGGSGMGLQTLLPIFQALDKLRQDYTSGLSPDADAAAENLTTCVLEALADPSHENWMRDTANVERLVARIELTFAPAALKESSSSA